MTTPPPGWRPQSPDTSYEAEQVLFAIYRRMTPAEKVERIAAIRARLSELAEQFERKMHPAADDAEISLRVFARRLDRETMLAAFGRDPARDPAKRDT